MLQEHDALLGQLLLARGEISLRELMHCIHRMQGHDSLGDVITRAGLLSPQRRDAISREIVTSTPRITEEIDTGQTLILETIHHTPVKVFEAPQEKDWADEIHELHILGERYQLIQPLGQGGMGRVWLAYDRRLTREVALKVLRPDTEKDKEELRRKLEREAKITGRLEHPSIIPVHDIGELDGLGLFYTMRVVREQSLEERLENATSPLRLQTAVSLLVRILLALQYAHDRKLIHLDLKPHNILVGSYGEAFVIDWGLAREFPAPPPLPSQAESDDDEEDQLNLVGTPKYMSPEQVMGEDHRFGPPTDVYAMGAILYRVLTGEPVFRVQSLLELLMAIVRRPPTPPSERAPERDIPEELEEICLKALSKEPEERYQSAQEMARELELFLEGIKEGERARGRAEALLERAHSQRKAYHGARGELADAQEKLTKAQMEIQSWASPQEKEPLWKLEQEVEDLRMEIERHFGEAARTFGQALGHVQDHEKARQGLCELYWERFLEAEASGDRANALYFEGLVRQYNDGQYDTLLAGNASLSVDVGIEGATCKLYRYERGMHRLQAILERSLSAPFHGLEVPHGSYLLTIEADGFIHRRVPLLLERLQSIHVAPQLYPKGALPDDMVVIEGGEFLSGHISPSTQANHKQSVTIFAIMKHPVTCQEYADFLTALSRRGQHREALERCPRTNQDGPSYFAFDTTKTAFIVPEEDSEGDAWDPQWPICLITALDAEAYAVWRSERDGMRFRLPTALEWEKAARGVDGRLYSWGNEFDASFCRVRESAPGRAMPAPVGSYPIDCSPYGVMDMTGCICEWTATDSSNSRICYGASYATMQAAARLDWPFTCPPSHRQSTYGFRLAASLDIA